MRACVCGANEEDITADEHSSLGHSHGKRVSKRCVASGIGRELETWHAGVAAGELRPAMVSGMTVQAVTQLLAKPGDVVNEWLMTALTQHHLGGLNGQEIRDKRVSAVKFGKLAHHLSATHKSRQWHSIRGSG